MHTHTHIYITYRLILIILVILIERSLSKLKIIKIYYLRSIISRKKLNRLAFVIY